MLPFAKPNFILEITCTKDDDGNFVEATTPTYFNKDLNEFAMTIWSTTIWAKSEPDGSMTSYFSPYGTLHLKHQPASR